METGLRGRNALLTGGSSGIGKGIALALAGEGVNLAIASRNPDESALEEIRAKGVRVVRISADVSREEDAVRMVDEAMAAFGELHCFVNNAAWTWHQSVTRIDSESWYKTLDTNLSSCMWASREVAKHMIRRGSGGIVIIGSTVRFFPAYREASYRVSKMGLKMLMEELAIELSPHGIRVNMVTPGHFRTRMTGGIPEEIEEKLKREILVHRFGNPVEVGNAVAFLLSDALSGYTVGADIVIDGGLTLRPLTFISPEEIRALNEPEGGTG